MTTLIISGYHGRMGHALRTIVTETEGYADFSVVAGFDALAAPAGHPIFAAPDETPEAVPKADIIIDFSNHAFVPAVLRYAIKTATPAVIATTALGEDALALIAEAAKTIPVFHSANMSLGINIALKMAQLAAPAAEQNFDIEIIEAHHNQKKDAPSGTAIMLANAINEALETPKTLVYGRQGKETAPQKTELGIHAVRGGTLPGKHTIMFAGPDELIEITHTAYSNKIFATGALKAARYLLTQKSGLYDMNDLLN